MGTERSIALLSMHRGRDQLAFVFAAGDLRFSTAIWYGDVDFDDLQARFGEPALNRLQAHVGVFELSKLLSLRPDVVDFGPAHLFVTPALEALWGEVAHRVWAQWRYEHDLPHYAGPRFAEEAVPRRPDPVPLQPGPVPVLGFCGGGKDSLVAARLLERGGVPWASLGYSHSVYGRPQRQHALLDGLLDHCQPALRHKIWFFDDFLDSPVAQLHPELGVRHLHAAETPASLFAALPIVLQHGYGQLVLAHERSANTGNLVWPATGEEVNHQWGKSLQAERLLAAYLDRELVRGLRYYSLLQPVHDPVIFELLRQDLDAVPATHSCNVRKPWCLRCPKCLYVWLNYAAFLPEATVRATFGSENLLDVAENEPIFRRLLGLEAHTPFECVGQPDEAKLAFALCRQQGRRGRAMALFEREVPAPDLAGLAARLARVEPQEHGLPAEVAAVVLPQLEAAAAGLRERLG